MPASTDWFADFLKYITGTSVVAAIAGWVLKHYIETQSKADLKRFELDLKHSHEESLASLKQKLETQAKSDERIKREIVLWANPILDAAISLEKRLHNILKDEGYKALDPGYTPAEWSITSAYMVPSTLYLFGRYFCWIQLLRLELSFELFRSSKEKDEFFKSIDAVAGALGNYPPSYDAQNKPVYYDGDGSDTQVFRLQQQGIGELLTVRRKDGRACQSYAHFCSKFADATYQNLLGPVYRLIECVTPSQKRWRRLMAVDDALGRLIAHCNALLSPDRS
ncbi:MAG TPA: hypothetical protein VLW65_25115 [Bryobacteraceae bacterium]|nr:hypothetical protein [Bryobacteraceae bacterium]